MKAGRMQAKDITDDDFFAAIEKVLGLRDTGPYPIRGLGASRWDVAAMLADCAEDVSKYDGTRTDWDYEHMPVKVVLAKAAALIRRGLLTGCACGCRGDWQRVDDTP